MKEKLKSVFLLGIGVATYGLNKDNRKKIQSIVGELIEEGKITLTEGRILAEDLIAESKKAAKDVRERAVKAKARVDNARVRAKKEVTKKDSSKKKK